MIQEKHTIPYADSEATVIYGRADSCDTVKAIACPQYDEIKVWCDNRGIPFTDKWNIATVMLAIFHEEAVIYEPKNMFKATLYNEKLARETADKLAAGYIEQDVKNDFGSFEMLSRTNITGDQIYDMWLKSKRCKASGRFVYLNPGVEEKIKASMDRISNKKPHTLDNCRLLSLWDNKRRNTQDFHVYRSKEGYLANTNSAYTDDMLETFVRRPATVDFPEMVMKSKAHHQRVNDVKIPENISSFDFAKSYAGCMYQLHFGDNLDEFTKDGIQQMFNFPVFSMYDLPEEVVGEIGFPMPGRYYLKFNKPVTCDDFAVASSACKFPPEVCIF
jgi:hypothetical protein